MRKLYTIETCTKVQVYDNGGKSCDRYTVVIYGSAWQKMVNEGYRPALGLSRGGKFFSQFTECKPGPHLGELVEFSSLDMETQTHIISRLCD
jgi:hypothetical protein